MGFPYHFVSLTDEQNKRRRELLDNYGQFAQLSVLLLPLIYQLSIGLQLLVGRLQRQGSRPSKDRQSPTITHQKKGEVASGTWRKIRWMLDGEIAAAWGTRREWLNAFLWTLWLLLLVVKDTGDDYLHITKRFGIVAASQLPIHYLLAFKAWSPIQYLTRMSHEELNPYHRLLGRIIVLFFTCHASLYLNFYVQNSLLLKRIKDWDVILGLSAITASLLLFTTALARIRQYSYRLFFYLHVVLSIALLPILYFHVVHLRAYIMEAGALYLILIIQRNYSQVSAEATITKIENTNLLSISVPLHKSLRSRKYVPGQHIYLGFPSLPQKLRINPFTIANLPSSDRKLNLIARMLSGSTAMLADLASKPQPTSLVFEGPYGAGTHFPNFSTFDQVLFVAGGVGATFTLPIYTALLRSTNGEQNVRFVWTVRDQADAIWGVEALRKEFDALPESFELHISGNEAGLHRAAKDDTIDSIELQERTGLLNSQLDTATTNSVRKGRPDLHSIVNEVFSRGSHESIAVLVCGPAGMGANLRKEVGKWVGERDIYWHNEEFGW